jgi:hypothetical protein
MSIISLIFIIIILIYIFELEKKKCDCSKHWMRDFIKYVSILMLALTVIVLFIPNIRELCKNNVICRLLVGIYGLVGFAYIIILLVYYFHIQKKTNCECALDWKRHALLYPIIGFGIIFLMMIIVIIFIFKNPGKFISTISKNFKKVSRSSKKSIRK